MKPVLKRKMNILFASLLLILIASAVLVERMQSDAHMKVLLGSLERDIAQEHWKAAAQTSKSIDKEWNRNRIRLSFEDSHEIISSFERTWAQCKVYIVQKEEDEAAALAADLIQLWKMFEG